MATLTAEAARFFAGNPTALSIYEAVAAAVSRLGPHEVRVTKSQVAFRRGRSFAFVWRPEQYLRRAEVPAVLSIATERRLESDRFKSVVHPAPRVWMHHLELHSAAEVDEEVAGWLGTAYAEAGAS